MSSGGGLCFCYGAAAALCEVRATRPCWGSVGVGGGGRPAERGRSQWDADSSVAVFVIVCGWTVVLLYLFILQAVYMEQYRTSQLSIDLFH